MRTEEEEGGAKIVGQKVFLKGKEIARRTNRKVKSLGY
jgi:hypothetical protein